MLHRFWWDESGVGMVVMLFGVMMVAFAGALAMDFANRARVVAALQATADPAATSAAIRLSQPISTETPEQQARSVVMSSFAGTPQQDAWTEARFRLGTWQNDGFVARGRRAPMRCA